MRPFTIFEITFKKFISKFVRVDDPVNNWSWIYSYVNQVTAQRLLCTSVEHYSTTII